MPAPPTRDSIAGTPTNAQAKAGFGALYDYVLGLLGATGNAAEAQAILVPNDSVAFAKLQNIATARILGRSTAGTGDVEELTGAQAAAILTGSVGQLAGMRNLLINGNFQINQRAYVSGTNVGGANTYTLDRWRVVTSGQNLTFSASGNGNQITAPAGGVEQVIEGVNIGGGTYCLNWTGTATASVNGTARAKGESFTLTANANATVRFTSGTVSLAQLEPGTVATPFEHRPFGAELALCQRYYEVGAIGSASTHVVGVFKVTKRALPTMVRTGVAYTGSESGTTFTALNAESYYGWGGTQSGGQWTAAAEL